ncbi:MAG: nucleotide sugar dehydrogenase, partial [Chlamydiia bacterium]|nr:nucleotide sugar dehydrogenase [Chlamydiia bacterium]
MTLTLEKLAQKDLTVGIVGLGYVGYPLALQFAESGARVLGFDVDATKIAKINRGESYIKHINHGRLQKILKSCWLQATDDFSRIAECDAVIICVPTPLSKHLEPDLSYIVKTGEAIAPHLKKGALVSLESTTWPGTTEEVLGPIVGDAVHLAYSPEREDPGNKQYHTKTIPKLVGGATEEALDLATALYRIAIDQVIPVKSTRSAEAAKLLENIFRSVNIALVNELKIIFDRMGIDVWEVIEAASTKPFGFMPFWPGPGLGGHCIPIDPFYLTWKAKEFGVPTRFIELAGEINRSMPHYVVQKVMECLNHFGKALKHSKILILGLAYKPDIDDYRESPSLELMRLLEEKGAHVSYNDPF